MKIIVLIISIVSIFLVVNAIATESDIVNDIVNKKIERWKREVAFKHGAEPEGFRDVKWGQDISNISGFKLIEKTDQLSAIYIRPSDKNKIGKIKLYEIRYEFWKDKFWRVGIIVKKATRAIENDLAQVLLHKFGGKILPDYEYGITYVRKYIASSEKVEVHLDRLLPSDFDHLRMRLPKHVDLILEIYKEDIFEEKKNYYLNQAKDDF